ncbi:MAG TPA: methylmalonyl-CoA mutase family protein, partial [Acidimicrobiia bacterium]
MAEELHQTDSGIEIRPVYTAEDPAGGLEERLGRPGAAPYTRGVYAEMYRK